MINRFVRIVTLGACLLSSPAMAQTPTWGVIYVQSVAPNAGVAIGHIWVDTSTTPATVKVATAASPSPTWSTVSSGGAVAWADITGKPSTFSPSTHASSHVTGGSDVIATAVAGGNAGLLSGADKTKLDNTSGTNTGDQSSVTGNAGSATALQTARTINGVSFDGTANITVAAAAGTLTGATLASGVTASSLTTFGTAATLTTTGNFGYATGAGGTVTQTTNKATAVTLNKACGQITMNAAALAAATIVTFAFNNSVVAATDLFVTNHVSGGTFGAYTINMRATGAGTASVAVRNNTAGSLSEAVVIGFCVVKGVTS